VVAVLLLVGGIAAGFGWKRVHEEEEPAAAEVSNDMEGEVWMENPESIWEDHIFESVFVDAHDEAMFVRI
jgi:hypothetical protein